MAMTIQEILQNFGTPQAKTAINTLTNAGVFSNTSTSSGTPKTPPVVTPVNTNMKYEETPSYIPTGNPNTSATTNLYDYYSSKGLALPSVSARAPLAAQAGITGTYTGTAAQNTQLLNYLSKGGVVTAPNVTSTSTSTGTPKGNIVYGNTDKTGMMMPEKALADMTVKEAAAAGKTAEYNALVSGIMSGKSVSSSGYTPTIATSAIDVKSNPTYVAPPTPINNTPVNTAIDLTAGYSGLEQQIANMNALQTQRYNQSLTEEQTARNNANQAMSDATAFKDSRMTNEELINKFNDKYQIDESFSLIQDMIPEMNSLREQLNKLRNEESMAVENLKGQGRGIPLGVLGAQESKILRTYAIRESAVAANLSAIASNVENLRGNITTATNLANNAINAYLYDTQQKVQDYEDLYTYNKEIIDNLDTEQKEILDQQYSQVKEELDRKRAEAEQAASYAIANKVAYTPGDTLATVSAKVAAKAGNETVNDEYTKSIDYVKNNPDATEQEIEIYLRSNTKLTESQIKSVLGTRSFLTVDYFKNAFTDDQLKTAANDAGYRHWYSPWSTEKDNYLNSLMEIINNYRNAGYTDTEILNMMNK